MAKFRKKAVVVEAFQWTGGYDQTKCPQWFVKATKTAWGLPGSIRFIESGQSESHLVEIYTLEGTHCARPGDWIIKGVAGELYPCKPDIFEQTYEPEKED